MKLDARASVAERLANEYRLIGGERAYLNPTQEERIERIRTEATKQLDQLNRLAQENLQNYAQLKTVLPNGTQVFCFPRFGKKRGEGEKIHSKITEISLTLKSVFLEIVPLHQESAAGHK
ncbi:MAG: hypothetical protein P0S95_00060 [Rhabdochlamydiaceae bacterium]|nr:hypothetical protein [Candidatus Amphrikana amoebophyrae]